MLKLRLAAIIATALVSIGLTYAARAEFDPHKAFCERQTFELATKDELQPWLRYLAGLRSGETRAPDPNACTSSTVRFVLSAVTDAERAASARSALVSFYASRAITGDSAWRRTRTDEDARWLNDVTAASLLWLVCPGRGSKREQCFEETITNMPVEYRNTSPVFCIFSNDQTSADVEIGKTGSNLLFSHDCSDLKDRRKEEFFDNLRAFGFGG